jgi:putative endonuclease
MNKPAPLNLIIPSVKEYFTYIIRSSDGFCYCGITENMQRRLEQHETGQSKSTRHHKGYQLLYIKKWYKRIHARQQEKIIKGFGVQRWYYRESLTDRIQESRNLQKTLFP